MLLLLLLLLHAHACTPAPQLLLQPTHPPSPAPSTHSHPAGVQHDAHGGAQAAGRQVLPELGAHGAGVAVRTGDLAPNAAEVGALLLGLGLVDEGQLLAQVELGLLGALHALNPDDGGVVGLHLAVADVALNLALDEQPHALASHGCCGLLGKGGLSFRKRGTPVCCLRLLGLCLDR
eukprot:1159846-Pelagomonas_calceolata.AAC.28